MRSYKLINDMDSSLSVTAQIFRNRGMGYTREEIEHYLNTTDNDLIDPATITNIERGVKMLISHISAGDKTYLQVDQDCDGFTSSALLLNYLNRLFPNYVQTKIQYRVHTAKAHGIISADLVPEDVKLVIAPDASSNEYEIHRQLQERGIDVLVIDHHKAEKYSPYACVINNQLDTYPTKSLSGVAMVYKFCKYIDELLDVDYADDFVDLVALGMAADVMDIRNYESKRLMTLGLENIRNPFIKAMTIKQAYSLDQMGGLSAYSISFYIAPFVNAVARVGSVDEKITLLESLLDFRAYELVSSTKRGCTGQLETKVEQSVRTCSNVKNRQTKMRDEAIAQINKQIEKENLLNHKILLIQMKDNSLSDIGGLIANQLVSTYHHPTLILFKRKQVNENGEVYYTWEGSGRGDQHLGLDSFNEFLRSCPQILYAEGHDNAFGTGVKEKDLEDFIKYSDEQLKNYDFSPEERVDFIFTPATISDTDVMQIGNLCSIWGPEIPEAIIAVEDIKVHKDNLKIMGKKQDTISITLPNGISLIKFRSSAEEIETLSSISDTGCVTIKALGTCYINKFYGQETPQIKIQDYEIVGRTNYYF